VFISVIAPYVGGILYKISRPFPFVLGIALTLFIASLAATKLFGDRMF
jgi:hypothetical protein